MSGDILSVYHPGNPAYSEARFTQPYNTAVLPGRVPRPRNSEVHMRNATGGGACF